MEFKSNIDEDILLCDDVRNSVNTWTADVTSDGRFADTLDRYNRTARMKVLLILALIAAAALVTVFSLQYGEISTGVIGTLQILWDNMFGNADYDDYITHWTLYRTPPIIGAVIGGAGLAICGAVMQSVLRNPMADPYTTGISSGASFGAAVAITSGALLAEIPSLTVLLAFVFAMIPVLVILGISKMTNAAPITIIMTGIGVMYIFNAGTSIIQLKAGSSYTAALENWLMGNVQLVEWGDLLPMGIIVGAGIIISMFLANKINVLSTGDENAKAMGIDADRLRIVCMVLTAIVSAGVISFTGLIGFVGLVCPHIVRMFVGADNRYLIPASAAFGAALMVAAHLIGKNIISPTIIPVGIIMSCIGGPVFIWLVVRRNKNTW